MAKRARPSLPLRNRELARIHTGAAALGMDDDTRRDFMERITGKRSAGDMTPDERSAVIDALVGMGFKADPRPGKPKNVKDVPLLRKVEALLADGKKPWSYAHAMAKQMFKRDRLEFCRPDELHKIAAALQIDANRHKEPRA